MMLLPEKLALVVITLYWKAPWRGCRGPGCVPSRGVRIWQAGLIGGEIRHAYDYREREERIDADYSRV
jgi:hypothetical protein